VIFVNANDYPGRIIINPYNTRQIKTQQFAFPRAGLNLGAKMIKYCTVQ